MKVLAFFLSLSLMVFAHGRQEQETTHVFLGLYSGNLIDYFSKEYKITGLVVHSFPQMCISGAESSQRLINDFKKCVNDFKTLVKDFCSYSEFSAVINLEVSHSNVQGVSYSGQMKYGHAFIISGDIICLNGKKKPAK